MSTVYVAFEDRLLVASRDDPADEWTVERLADHRPQCVTAHPDAAERVLVGTFDAGLHLSTDGGETFRRVGAPTMPEAVMSLTVDPTDADAVWAGTEPSRVFRSPDGGERWEELPGLTDLDSAVNWYFPPRPNTHHVRWIEVDPTDPERVYVGIEAGALVRSFDGGDTWQDRPEGARRDNHSLATHPDAPERVYAAAGDGYAQSEDAGDTWAYPQDGLDHRYCWSVRPDPADPDTVVVSAASGPRAAHTAGTAESYVYRREGDGDWAVAMDGLPDPDGLVRAVLATTGEPGVFYALTNHGLFRSTDAAREWAQVGLPWDDDYRQLTPRGLVVLP